MEIHEMRKKFEKLPSSAGQDAGVYLTIFQTQTLEIAELVIQSSRSKNALSGEMISELTERIAELETWAASGRTEPKPACLDTCEDLTRCLLIRGHGNTFCSGSDLKTARATLDPISALELAQIMQYNFKRIAELPVISVAHIEGYALGGGAELALATDLRIMSSDAKIGFVHAKNGICCGWGGGTRLVQLVGRSNALEILSSSRLIERDEAERLGIACRWDGVSVHDFCAKHAIKSRSVSLAVKSVVQAACELPAQRALDMERQMFVQTWGKGAHLEALDKNLKHNK